MGPQLMENMRAQAVRFGAEIVTDDVTAIKAHGDIKSVTDGAGNVHQARALILATGSGYRELGLPDEKGSVVTVFRGAQPAMVSFSVIKILLLWVEVTLHLKKPPS